MLTTLEMSEEDSQVRNRDSFLANLLSDRKIVETLEGSRPRNLPMLKVRNLKIDQELVLKYDCRFQ